MITGEDSYRGSSLRRSNREGSASSIVMCGKGRENLKKGTILKSLYEVRQCVRDLGGETGCQKRFGLAEYSQIERQDCFRGEDGGQETRRDCKGENYGGGKGRMYQR